LVLEDTVKKLTLIVLVSVLFLAVSCENSTNTNKNDNEVVDETVDEAVDEIVDEVVDEEVADEDATQEFNPEDPGYAVEFFFVDMAMMGNPMTMISGYVMKTAREDLDEEEVVDTTLDTCVFGESLPSVPECESDADCAPEQKCVPDYDDSGNPEPGTEHCATPDRESLDIGPIVISGFEAGPQTFLFEPNDSVYKLDGQGDGSVDPSLITYDVEYMLNAENPTPEDLDPFSGQYLMPPALNLTSHEVVEGQMGAAIVIDTTKPVKFEWTGNGGNGYVEISITAAKSLNEQVSVTCKAIDDGEFEIPEGITGQLVFGSGPMVSMMNMLVMTRHAEGSMSGESITSGSFFAEQMIMMNVTPPQ
jgi:hypothetical protein